MTYKFSPVAIALAAALAAGGCGEQTSTAPQQKAPVAMARSCCQCPGVWDNSVNPPVYKLAPACANSSPSDAVCEADCKSKGYTTGSLQGGTCQPAKSGNGDICQ